LQLRSISSSVRNFICSQRRRYACQWWTTNLHQNGRLSTTHDLGPMISPWARQA
jgi:hypothetical protein